MSVLKSLLTTVESSHRSWQDALGEMQLPINSTVNRSTKASPLKLLIGKEARPFNLLPIFEENNKVGVSIIRKIAKKNINKQAV